ncbi:MAG TPA: hypothetical protein ENN52_03770 [Methanofollis liminatans]|uniref:Uncharacterized protein n=1 Tax=Methanofollis liminatans TaxID=2201 RepID=A0A831PMM4_9EURY|nr:hypothetical protein [Methanofollis liminatans]
MVDPNVVTAFATAITALIAGLTYLNLLGSKKGTLKIEVDRHKEIYQASPSLKITAINIGQCDIVLEELSILYKPHFLSLKYSVR